MKPFVAATVILGIALHFTVNVFAPVEPRVISRPQSLVSRGAVESRPTPPAIPKKNYIEYDAIVTKYCACVNCCEKYPDDPEYGITASGKRVKVGMVALPKEFPFGTKITIPDFGDFICEDRGGAIRRIDDETIAIDIYVKSHQETVKFGKYRTTVKVFH